MLTHVFALASVIAYAHAANDWKTPCTSGACGYSWDGDGDKVAFSSMMLAGANQVLSDITPAAGWQIMGCDANWSSGPHDIRMVCAGTPEQMAECQHLYDNGGAEETIVRLPQNCGTGPFARVQKTYVPKDQSVPADVAKLARRAAASGGGSPPVVRGLTLDYEFNKVPTSRGKLLLGIASSNVGNKVLTRRDLMDMHQRGQDGLIARRGFFDSIEKGVTGAFDDVKDAAGDVVDKATSVAGNVADKVTSVAGDVANKVTSAAVAGFDKATSAVAAVATAAATAVVKGVKEVKDATTINKTDTSANIPISFDQNIPLLDADIGCEKGSLSGGASLHIDVDAKVNADVKFGYTFVGSVIPLQLDDVNVFSTMSGDASATFNIDATAQGAFDTGAVPFFKAGLPALSIPGIITLGPEFSLNGQLNMELDLEAQMSVTADFAFPNVDLVFPEKSGKSSAKATANKPANPLKLSTAANVDVTGTVTAHIIPRIDFGIDIGEGIAKATVFLDMDLAGELKMEVQVSSGGAAKAAGGAAGAAAAPAKDTETEASAKGTEAAKATAAKATAAKATEAKATEAKATEAKATAAKATAAKPPAAKATAAKGTQLRTRVRNGAKSPAKAGSKAVAKSGRREITTRATSGGCVTLTGKMSINAGLDGTLKPLFDKETKFPIFSTQAELFKKCFGDGVAAAPAARRSISGGSTVARLYRGRRTVRPRAAKAAGGTKNEITPGKSTGSTAKLACGTDVIPLGGLTALI